MHRGATGCHSGMMRFARFPIPCAVPWRRPQQSGLQRILGFGYGTLRVFGITLRSGSSGPPTIDGRASHWWRRYVGGAAGFAKSCSAGTAAPAGPGRPLRWVHAPQTVAFIARSLKGLPPAKNPVCRTSSWSPRPPRRAGVCACPRLTVREQHSLARGVRGGRLPWWGICRVSDRMLLSGQ